MVFDDLREMARETQRQSERDEDKALSWDERRRELLGFMNNLLFGLALVALIFLQDTLANADVRATPTALYIFLVGLGLIGASLLFGLGMGISRLHDFRQEAKLAREMADPVSDVARSLSEFRRRREKIERTGKWTWRTF